MGHPVQGGAIIAGIGQTEFSKNSGRSELQLAAEASRAAILDAGLTPDQIDGMVTFTIDPTEDNDLMRTLGIPALGYSGRVRPPRSPCAAPDGITPTGCCRSV